MILILGFADKNGNILEEDDDGKGNYESSLTYTASESSTYYLSAASNAYIGSGHIYFLLMNYKKILMLLKVLIQFIP